MRPERGRRPLSTDHTNQRRHKPDYWLLIISVILLVIGLVVIYSISPGLSAQNNVGDNYFINRQLLATLLGVISFSVLASLPLNTWKHFQKPMIYAAAASAVAVRLFGERVNGAYRWIQLGGMSFQAAELIKFTLLIWLGAFLVQRIKEGSLGDFDKSLKPLGIALGIIGIVVGVVQSDFGSTVTMVGMMAAMAFVAGLPFRRILMAGGVVAIGMTLLILPSGYRRNRLMTFAHPESDCLNTGYQVCQALNAVGSGGLLGMGLGKSVYAYGYLPESANDSIFAIYAEKFGFIGTAALLGLFVALFSRLKRIIEHAPDDFSRLVVTGILAWLSTQALINIGAMIGLLPLKGITLPLISYGGTSLLFVTGALGLAFQISRYTTYSPSLTTENEGNRYENSSYRRRQRGAYNPASGRR
jgi:cell division protein FtsW